MKLFVALLLFRLSTPLCFGGEEPVTGPDVQSRIALLAGRLRSSEVTRVEIIEMPPRIATRVRVTPEMLERSFYYKLIINDISGGAYASSVGSAVASMSAEPVADTADLRWGVTFFGQNNERIVSLYFDPSGRRGAVDNVPASFKGDLFRWLNNNFSKAFK